MNKELQEIIEKSASRLVPGRYIYAKVSEPVNLEDCFFVSKDEDEVTAVVEEGNYDKLNVIERNKDTYSLIELRVIIPFYSVGFLAAVTKAIAERSLNVLVVSTYSKDYILVNEKHAEEVLKALEELGLKRL